MSQAEFYAGEVRRVECPQPYGFGAMLPSGGGLRGLRERRSRPGRRPSQRRPPHAPALRPGGIVLYGSNVKDELGHRIEFTDDPKPGTVKIKCSRIEITFGAHRLIIDKDMGVDGPV